MKTQVLKTLSTIFTILLLLNILVSVGCNSENNSLSENKITPKPNENKTTPEPKINQNNQKFLKREKFTEEGALNLIYGNYNYNDKCSIWTLNASEISTLGLGKEIKELQVRVNQFETFERNGNENIFMVTKAGYPDYTCRPCSPFIGTAIFEKIEDKWYLISESHYITSFGFFGDIPKGKLVQIGQKNFGILFKVGFLNMGIYEEDTIILGEISNKIEKVFELDTAGNNEGICNDSSIPCYKYESQMKFIPSSSNPEFFDIELFSSGTKPLENEQIKKIFGPTTYSLMGKIFQPIKLK